MQAAAFLLGEHVTRVTCNLPFELAKSTFKEDQGSYTTLKKASNRSFKEDQVAIDHLKKGADRTFVASTQRGTSMCTVTPTPHDS